MRGVFSALPLFCLFAFSLLGCGYTTQSTLDAKYQSIYVSAFYDATQEYGLQAPLTNAITRRFITDSRLDVVAQEHADLLMEGVILGYRLRGLTTDDDDEASQFSVIVTAAVRLIDQRSGERVWEEPQMIGETIYYPRSSGQSTDRLRGNVNAFLPPVRSFASDEENQAASEALAQLASDIFYRTVEPW